MTAVEFEVVGTPTPQGSKTMGRLIQALEAAGR